MLLSTRDQTNWQLTNPGPNSKHKNWGTPFLDRGCHQLTFRGSEWDPSLPGSMWVINDDWKGWTKFLCTSGRFRPCLKLDFKKVENGAQIGRSPPFGKISTFLNPPLIKFTKGDKLDKFKFIEQDWHAWFVLQVYYKLMVISQFIFCPSAPAECFLLMWT